MTQKLSKLIVILSQKIEDEDFEETPLLLAPRERESYLPEIVQNGHCPKR